MSNEGSKNHGMMDPDCGYLNKEIPPENVYGHAKKVRLFREAIERLRSKQGGSSVSILDIGCGSGYAVTRFLSKEGDTVLGIDMHPPNIAYAKKHFGQTGIDFACVDAERLLLERKSFDIIVMADVLEHLDHPAEVLLSAMKLLEPEGHILITIPNGRGPFELESWLSKLPLIGPVLLKLTDLLVALMDKTLFRGMWSQVATVTPSDLPYNSESGHVQFFTRSQITELLSGVGLEIERSRNLSFLSGPFTNYVFSPWSRFCRWNAGVADRLSPRIVSAWFVECKKTNKKE